MCCPDRPLVCVVDDEEAVRNFVRRILESHEMTVRCHASADAFLAEFDESTTSCIVTDLRMPGVDGLQLHERLKALESVVSVVVLTGHADVPTAVRLMEDGVSTLLQKPFRADNLASAVENAVKNTQTRRKRKDDRRSLERRLDLLTPDEHAVLDCVVAGLTNNAIALKLALSMRTLDRRRQQMLAKMGVQSPVELAALIAAFRITSGS